MGGAHRGQTRGKSNNPRCLGDCSGPDRMGAGPKLGRTICRGGEGGYNERDLQGPPAAIEVCPSDQLRPSLKPSLDFDLQAGVNNRKREQWKKEGRKQCKE